jgi:hypothetical protein
MAKICAALATHGPMSQRKILATVGGKYRHTLDALALLQRDGYVSDETPHKLIKPWDGTRHAEGLFLRGDAFHPAVALPFAGDVLGNGEARPRVALRGRASKRAKAGVTLSLLFVMRMSSLLSKAAQRLAIGFAFPETVARPLPPCKGATGPTVALRRCRATVGQRATAHCLSSPTTPSSIGWSYSYRPMHGAMGLSTAWSGQCKCDQSVAPAHPPATPRLHLEVLLRKGIHLTRSPPNPLVQRMVER